MQKFPNRPANLTINSLKKYIGICIYMSIIHVPNVRNYWSNSLGFPQIKGIMSQKEFERIRAILHFNDNSKIVNDKTSPQYDKLYKLRPIIDVLNSKFGSIPFQQTLSVDEQICASKARHHMKQYLPAKPHKWGYKLYVLCGSDGFSYKFEIYAGSEYHDQAEPDLGSSANTVIRLCKNVPENQNFRIYFDNYYTSVPLLVYLAKKGIYSLGTVRRSRIPNTKIPNEKELKLKERGTSLEYVSNIDGVEVSSTVWKDNKAVTLLSTFVGKMPLSDIKRYDRKKKQSCAIECPHVIKEYNKHMGGVDLMDSLIGRYKIQMRTKKWYFRLFYHLLDMALVNSWLLYKKVSAIKRHKNILRLAEFRAEVAYCLCNSSTSGECVSRRGRPSNEVENLLQVKKKRSATTAFVPPRDVRKDSYAHWPVYNSVRQRCKLPECKSFSYIKCSKCGVNLCLNKNNNCFLKFHTS